MVDMPRGEASRGRQIADYALGIIHESAWILGMTLLAFLIAVVALAVLK